MAVCVLWVTALVSSLGACGGSSTKTSAPASTASYQTLVAAGVKLLALGNTTAAEQLFQQAIAKNPHDPVAHYNLGVIYQGAGQTRAAVRQYNQALRANPHYVPALYNEAVLVSAHNAPLAEFLYRQAIRFQPRAPTAYLHLGLLETETKPQYPEARRDLMQALRQDPSLRASIPRSWLHQLPSALTGTGKSKHR